jgi:asparagine synthase (glutamine-hydrolysing)
MCGIVGIIDFRGPRPSPDVVRRMMVQAHHRGPDSDGLYIDDDVALGHTRLSIIDLEGGQQPMHNEDRSLWVTFNGEIFNYVELRELLTQKGHRFATRSDTEVILHCYEEYGERCVDHFNGQWAFAVWDSRKKRAFLSRDRLGIRPLYYTTVQGKFLFSSEIKSLLSHPEVSGSIDPEGLSQLFTFWSTLPPRTVFRGISELAPGHNVVVTESEVRNTEYWDLNYDIPPEGADYDGWTEQLLDLLTDATRLRLRSDVPVGVYVSGGLDSSVTAGLVHKCHGNSTKAFSVAFDDAEFDESPYQETVAGAFGAEHHTIRCLQGDIGRVFPEVIRHTEKPTLRTAPAPLYLLSKLVRDQGYKVVLTGEGADEMLGGYDIFKEVKIRRFCASQPGSDFRALLFKRLYPYLPNIQNQSAAYLAAFFRARPDQLDDPLFSHLPRWQMTARLKKFFSTDLRNQLTYYDPYVELLESLPDSYRRWDPFCRAQYLETKVLLPGYILSSQGDRMAMAHSVEGRFPFLDYRLAELAARMPVRLKMKGLNEKYVLKKAAQDLVPAEVVRRTKQPYRAPEAASFVDPPTGKFRYGYVEELLAPDRLQRDGLFCPTSVGQLVRKARAGKVVGIRDNMALVGILSTQLLVDQLVDQPLVTPEPLPSYPAAATDAAELTAGANA